MSGFARIAPDTLRIERMLDAPVETVWRWLAEPELRRKWFAGGSPAQPEAELALTFDHDELSDGDVPYPPRYAKYKGATARERVLRMEPPRLLSFTWDGGAEGTVTFELTPVGDRTRLVLTHAGISGPPAMTDFGGGWMSHLAVMEARLAGRAVPDFWALHAGAEAEVAARLAT
jgi:uncharacterized protein YndB with AHSA1/START domain